MLLCYVKLPEGKPPFSYGLGFPMGFPMVMWLRLPEGNTGYTMGLKSRCCFTLSHGVLLRQQFCQRI